MSQTQSIAGATPTAAARPTRARFVILGLLSVAVTINYLDRAVLGIAAPSLQKELGLDPALMGLVFSAFSWSYFAAQVPCGILLDRFGAGFIYWLSLVGWSLFTLLHSMATGFGSLIGLRLGLGIAEAPCFPANSSVIGMWFPRAERARAIGVYTAAEYVGLGFLSPILFWILADYGWRMLFVATGGVGLLYAIVWWFGYQDPHRSTRANEAELDGIWPGSRSASSRRCPISPAFSASCSPVGGRTSC